MCLNNSHTKAARIINGILTDNVNENLRNQTRFVWLTLNMLPKIILMTMAIANEISAKARVIPSPLRSCL